MDNAEGFDGYAGDYLYADFICDKIFALGPEGGLGFEREVFREVGIKPVVMGFGLGGAVYYVGFGPNGAGEIREIVGSAS